jgi:superfamily II DNA/RNA helicase
VPNSTARRNARAAKPRHKQARTAHQTSHRGDARTGRRTPEYADNRADRRARRFEDGGDRRESRDRGSRAFDAPPDRNGRRGDGRTARSNDRDRTNTRERDRPGHRTNERPTAWDRDERPDRRGKQDRERPATWDRQERRARPDRSTRERPSAWDRGDRPTRTGGQDRAATRDRGEYRAPARDRATSPDRGERPNRAHRYDRTNAAGRFERPTHGDRRERTIPADRFEQPSREDRRERAAARDQVTSSWNGEIAEARPARKTVTFAELGLPTPLLAALEEAGIEEPFPIQAATLPDALAGRDVLGRAQTGSGKTLAFGLALLTRLHKGSARPGRPRGLVLVPTRELAVQVADALLPLARSLGLWCRTVVGGLSFSRQADQLERGIDLLIATPGRLSDHVRQGTCKLDDVRFVTLDEADQMADMGFLPQVRAILDLVPEGQRMLFSATLDRDVAALVDEYLTEPVTHSVSPPTASVSTMEHHLLLVSREDKPAVVAEMAARDGRTIMFLRTKHHVDRLTRQLRAVGVEAGALHGGKPQGARNRVLGEFKDGRLPVLVATDVAARGIHVDGVSLVVHVDPPADAKGYLHRAGRTARAGEAGTVVTLVTHQERRTVFRMTEQAGVEPERTKVRPGDADLVRITGARTPSGEPVAEQAPRRPSRPSSGPAFRRHPARRRAPRPVR